eukprot:CAMPEP_0174872530 /NCGR_PEP_ID=MMETSP1114-20130205/73412_1 /TAXON_ID=312471 /ORGANISM="Neobodo designis, Strain CCAP 1951/1" /LENGTH=54 /DNA_ID=CAMNT_0016107835 /DNA_START=323 /DNA_END=485 /DNA_ORIENTATION=+
MSSFAFVLDAEQPLHPVWSPDLVEPMAEISDHHMVFSRRLFPGPMLQHLPDQLS